MSRLTDLRRFYALLSDLEHRVGGARRLGDAKGDQGWPTHGVYFLLESGEARSDSGAGPRVVRVGTHSLRPAKSTLWSRLSAHRGVEAGGGGNHRGSIFRLLVGEALLRRDGAPLESWGVGQSASVAAERLGSTSNEIKEQERGHEQATSAVLGEMKFLWIRTPPEAFELRARIERGAVALLSNHDRIALDEPSPGWLGRHSSRPLVRAAGLWNNEYVEEAHDPAFLDLFEQALRDTPPLGSQLPALEVAVPVAAEPVGLGASDCPFCSRAGAGQLLLANDLAAAFPDGFPLSAGHTLVVPRRHLASYFNLSLGEQQAMWQLVAQAQARLEREHRPAGFNVGINVGEAAGQTVGHAHIHVIPRYQGDVEDPRGGIRWVLPDKAAYWQGPKP